MEAEIKSYQSTSEQGCEGLIYGEDPKEGFKEGNVFYHPELKLQFNLPANWAYQNSPAQVQLASPDGKAMMIFTLAKGTSLQEAVTSTLQQYQLTMVRSDNVTVNGLNAVAMIADQVQQQQQQQQQQAASLRTLIYLIQYGGNIYQMIGVSSVTDFQSYQNTFASSFQSFRQLTEQAKLNKKAERIRIKTINAATTLEQALRNFGTSSARLNELAIINGMNLTDRLAAGTLIKVLGE
jgi:predicted Zn-dependent protease